MASPARCVSSLEAAIALIACYAMTVVGSQHATALALPAINGYVIDLGIFYVVFGAFVIIGCRQCGQSDRRP